MAINVEIKKNNNESNLNLLKRFGRKVQESGVLSYSRSIRYSQRSKSDFVKKRKRLNTIAKRVAIEKLIKLGKVSPRRRR